MTSSSFQPILEPPGSGAADREPGVAADEAQLRALLPVPADALDPIKPEDHRPADPEEGIGRQQLLPASQRLPHKQGRLDGPIDPRVVFRRIKDSPANGTSATITELMSGS